jgi:hypothetical protein
MHKLLIWTPQAIYRLLRSNPGYLPTVYVQAIYTSNPSYLQVVQYEVRHILAYYLSKGYFTLAYLGNNC